MLQEWITMGKKETDSRQQTTDNRQKSGDCLARISHTRSTASAQCSALTALRSVGLLNVPYSTFAGASVARLVRPVLSPLRDDLV